MVRRRGWIGRRAHATDPRTREARLSLPTLLFSLWLCLTTTRATAQPPWTDLPAPPIDALVEAPQGALPGVRWVRFDLESLAATLASAPGEDQRAPARVVLPMPAGSMEFDVRAATLFEPALARAWSDCRAFVGLGPSGERVRLELTPRGVSAWIRARTPEGALDDVWIDPATRSDPSLGIAYRPKDLPARAWACRTGEPDQPDAPLFQTVHVQGVVRTYRLAVAATGEYTDIQGGVVQARSAITTLVSRLNMMFESEAAIRFVLVAGNDSIVYDDELADPYTSQSTLTLLGENQANLDLAIGPANYDVGHLLAWADGGRANIGVACVEGLKARGVTGVPATPLDPYAVQVFLHELAHQFGALHTFNGIFGACTSGARSASAAYEPGSGSTLMSYASLCGPDDVILDAPDLYLHSDSLERVLTHAATLGSCAATQTTTNAAPSVEAGPDYSIPARTPFVLTAGVTDPEDDPFTITWEQRDLGSPNSLLSGDIGNGPIIRSRPPTAELSRQLPDLLTIQTNIPTPGELLPTQTRALHFRVTARDHNPAGSAVASDDMTLFVVSSVGPFRVTFPVGGESLAGTTTITWDPAGTQANGIDVANVRVLLSTDGGVTFPFVLSASTPNDGSEALALPDEPTSNARVRVEAVGNIFFDVSDTDFSILCSPPAGVSASTTLCDRVQLDWPAAGGATGYSVLRHTLNDVNAASFLGTAPTNSFADTTAVLNTNYFYWIRTQTPSCTSGPTLPVQGMRVPQTAPVAGLAAALDTTCGSIPLSWNAYTGATTYRVYRAASNNPVLASQIGTTAGTTFNDTTAPANVLRYYFVRAVTSCGVSPFQPSGAQGRRTSLPDSPDEFEAAPGPACAGVALTWHAGSRAAATEIFRGADSTFANATLIATVPGESYLDALAPPWTTHFYWARSTNACGPSAPTAPLSAQRTALPDAPAGLAASDATTCAQVELTWLPSPHADGYEVLRADTPAGVPTPLGSAVLASFVDATALPGQPYFYSVRATNACGAGAPTPPEGGSRRAVPNIMTQPQPLAACRGSDAVFTIAADDAESYQWFVGSTPAGADEPTLTLPAVLPALHGALVTCQVTNACGSVASDPAVLSVKVCGPTLHVDSSSATPGDGSSWTEPFQHLRDALAYAAGEPSIQSVHVAAGIHTPSSAADRDASFVVRAGLSILGGFPPAGGPESLRDALAHPTILSGDYARDDSPAPPSRQENARRLVVIGSGTQATLDGLTLLGAHADDPTGIDSGAGILVPAGATLHLVRSRLVDCDALASAGGMLVEAGGSCLVDSSSIVRCAAGEGGGAAVRADLSGPQPVAGSLTSVNSTWSANRATGQGGAIHLADGAQLDATYSTFAHNKADTGGGWALSGTGAADSCLFAQNTATSSPHVAGTLASAGFNLFDDAGELAGTTIDDLIVPDARIRPLALDAWTQTHALEDDSPAIDAASTTSCPPLDQRGTPRPIDGDGAGGPRCDVGAVEAPAPPHCVADFDDGSGTGTPDGGVTIDDLLYYLVLLDLGDVAADIDDGSGTGQPDGGVTVDDLLYFLERFSLGC